MRLITRVTILSLVQLRRLVEAVAAETEVRLRSAAPEEEEEILMPAVPRALQGRVTPEAPGPKLTRQAAEVAAPVIRAALVAAAGQAEMAEPERQIQSVALPSRMQAAEAALAVAVRRAAARAAAAQERTSL